MANVLKEEKKQQVLALGRLGWSLRRIQQTTRIRRETASAYLKAAGIAVRPPSGWGRRAPKPANEVITDSGPAKPTVTGNPNPENLSNEMGVPPALPGRQPNFENSGSIPPAVAFVFAEARCLASLVPLQLLLLFTGCDQAPLRGQQP